MILWMFIGGGVFIVLSGLALILFNPPSDVVATPTPADESQVPRVSLADSKAAFDAGTAVFVDVRDSSSFEVSHIPGALLIPLNDLVNRMNELDPSSWIITYCT